MTVSTTYPNGQVLISSALAQTAVAQLLQALTCGMLGINPPDFAQVRVDWPIEGQPFTSLPSVDGCYLAATTQDQEYSRVRDRSFSGTEPVTETWVYTRGWRAAWVLYGPNAADRARQIHSATFQDYFNDQLNLSNLYPLSDPPNPSYVPENFNAQWWPRADFHLDLYEQVTETIEDNAVLSVEVKVYDPSSADIDHPVADFTVDTP